MSGKKADLFSGFFIFLIALPLCMGIAMASGVPAAAGIITAMIGGCVSSFCGSSRLTIKGPAAGLIVIVLGAVQELGQGDLQLGYRRCLAVLCFAALIQMFFAWRKWGQLAELMPPSVVHGMLAAIGMIIISKQLPLLVGVTPKAKGSWALLAELPQTLLALNPEVAFVGCCALLALIGLPRLKTSWAKQIPAPLIAILVAVAASLAFDFEHGHHYKIFHATYNIGPEFLVNLPASFLSAVTFPDFSQVYSGVSLKYIFMFAIVGSIESLLTVSAVDSLDRKKQTSDLNRDLLSVGVGNLIAALLGGLPMISEIVRSKANIDNGAQSQLANFWHGCFLLIFVSFFPHLLHYIPLAALSAMLVYTGFRLASPSEFMHSFEMGKDQLLLFTTTCFVTLSTDLLVGVIAGLALKLTIHKIRGVSLRDSFRKNHTVIQSPTKNIIEVIGPSVFTNYLNLKKEAAQLKDNPLPLEINFRKSKVIDLTVQSKLDTLKREFGEDRLFITGLEAHKPASAHQHATKVLTL